MKNNLPCEIVQDLLPNYVSKLTSEVTDQAIEEHLKTCSICTKMLEQMNGELHLDAGTIPNKELDYLKKLRKKKRQSLLIGAAGLLTAVLFCILFLFKYFIIGTPLDPSLIQCETSYDEESKILTVTGSIEGISETVITGVKVKPEKDSNNINLLVYTTDRTFFNHKTTFKKEVSITPDDNLYIADGQYDRYLVWNYENEHIDDFIQIWQLIYENTPEIDWSTYQYNYLDLETIDQKEGYVFFIYKEAGAEDGYIDDTGLRFFAEKSVSEAGAFALYVFQTENPTLIPISEFPLKEMMP